MSRLLLYKPRQLDFKGYICAPSVFYTRDFIEFDIIKRAGIYRRLDVVKDCCLSFDSCFYGRIGLILKYFDISALPPLAIMLLTRSYAEICEVTDIITKNGDLIDMLFIKNIGTQFLYKKGLSKQ